MTSERIRKLAAAALDPAALKPDPIVEDDKVVRDDRVLFDQPTNTEVQRALNQWDKGKSEHQTNEIRQKQQERQPDYDELGSLAEFQADRREI